MGSTHSLHDEIDVAYVIFIIIMIIRSELDMMWSEQEVNLLTKLLNRSFLNSTYILKLFNYSYYTIKLYKKKNTKTLKLYIFKYIIATNI